MDLFELGLMLSSNVIPNFRNVHAAINSTRVLAVRAKFKLSSYSSVMFIYSSSYGVGCEKRQRDPNRSVPSATFLQQEQGLIKTFDFLKLVRAFFLFSFPLPSLASSSYFLLKLNRTKELH